MVSRNSLRFGGCLFVFVLAAGAAGCVPTSSLQRAPAANGGGGGGAAAAPNTPATSITVRPDPAQFSTTAPGESTTLGITIQNLDPANAATVQGVTITADDAHVFSLTPADLPATLAPGGTLTIQTKFTPTDTKDYGAFFIVAVDGKPSSSVHLSGTGQGTGFNAVPGRVDFGSLSQGALTIQRVYLRNDGTGPRTLRSITLSNDGGGQFQLRNVPTLPEVISPTSRESFEVTVTPSTAGAFTGAVAVATDDPARPTITIPLAVVVAQGYDGPDEFQVNLTTSLDQRQPNVAALPFIDESGTVVLCTFEDDSSMQPGDPEGPHQNYRAIGLDATGKAARYKQDSMVARHTDGVGYMGLAFNAVDMQYFMAGRYHYVLPPTYTGTHPHGAFHIPINSGGADFGGTPLAETFTAETLTTMDIADDSGQIIQLAVWSSSTRGLVGRYIDRDFGTFLSALFPLSAHPSPSQQNPHVAFNGVRFLVMWQDGGSIVAHLYGRRWDMGSVGGDFTVTDAGGTSGGARFAANRAMNDFLVVWQDGSGISGRLVHNDGTLGPVTTLTNMASSEMPAVASIPGLGTWMVTWAAPDGDQRGIYARKFSADLTPLSDEFAVNEIVKGDQFEPAVVWVPAASKWFFAWTGTDSDGKGIRGRFLPSPGAVPFFDQLTIRNQGAR